MQEQESNFKWWLRFVIVPLLASGLAVALLLQIPRLWADREKNYFSLGKGADRQLYYGNASENVFVRNNGPGKISVLGDDVDRSGPMAPGESFVLRSSNVKVRSLDAETTGTFRLGNAPVHDTGMNAK